MRCAALIQRGADVAVIGLAFPRSGPATRPCNCGSILIAWHQASIRCDHCVVDSSDANPDRLVSPQWQVPEWLRIPGLELTLGHPVREFTWRDIDDLCARKVRENQNLEFKQSTYDDNIEFAKDVAAMANATGGLIIIGIGEHEDCAETITTVRVDKPVDRHLHSVLLTSLCPILSGVTIGLLPMPGDEAKGVVLVLVPPGPDAPYGVRTTDAYLWPVRESDQTRYMREPELAARERFRGDEVQRERLATADSEGKSRLVRPGNVWLTVTVVPRSPGRWNPDRDAARNWVTQQAQHLPAMGFPTQNSVTRGRRRVIFSGNYSFTSASSDNHLELHTDGSGFAAVLLGSTGWRNDVQDVELLATAGKQPLPFDVARLEVWLLFFLQLLALHTIEAGSAGDYLARVTLLSPTAVDEHFDLDASGNDANHEICLVASEEYPIGELLYQRVLPGSRPVEVPSPLDVTVPATAVSRRAEMIEVVADMAQEIIAEFGQTPTVPLLLPGGTVNDAGMQNGRFGAILRGWAT